MKRDKIVSVILIVVILFSGFRALADKLEGNQYEIVIAEEFGKEEGEIHGMEAGEYDFKKELRPDWKRDMDKNIVRRKYNYILKTESDIYQNTFVKAFLEAYEQAYNSAYTENENEEGKTTRSTLLGLATSLGTLYGEIDGFKDFKSNRRSDWNESISRLKEMDEMFDLRKLSYSDKNIFIEEFTRSYQIGYKSAYYNQHFGIERNNKENGRTDGATFGQLLGEVLGIKDYHEGRKLNYNRNMPSELKIRTDYTLNIDNLDYTEGFINGFKNAYQEAYMNAYREARNNIVLLEDSLAYENGQAVGERQGKIQANMDHMEKKDNDWERSKPLSSKIISEYDLIYQTLKYRTSFINGYWQGYSKGYTETYKELSQTNAMNKTVSETIWISGGILESHGGGFSIEIEKGIYYKPVILTIDSLNTNQALSDRFISASNFYRLNMINPLDTFAKDKKIKISFEYYGDKAGGIYKLEDGRWTYLTSIMEDGKITAQVNPQTIDKDGNVFTVLVDTKTEIFHDIRGHWAKDEITAYIRRGVISGYLDNKFKPDQYITRAEFLILLSRLYRWYLPYDVSNNDFFEDSDSFNQFNKKHISYSLAHKYIIGYPDKHFRPYNHISYKEVDIIMKKVLRDPSFKWKDYAEKMIYDKKIRSSSYDSYDNLITRAEFAYMLYKLNEWKY